MMSTLGGGDPRSPCGVAGGEPALLELRGIGKRFPGVLALEDVCFTLQRGEIHALLGGNGAGKSTLIKVVTGVYERDAGEILLAGRAIAPRSPQEAQRLGVSTVYQEVNLVPHLSVAENLCLGREPTWLGCIRWRSVRRRADEALRRVGLRLDARRPLGSFSIAVQQMAAIARALDVEARVLILDEPTSSLDAREVAQLFDVMRRLKAQGLGIVFITHFLEQVYAVSDRITVLRNGRHAGTHVAAELPRLQLVAEMLGKDVEAAGPRTPTELQTGRSTPPDRPPARAARTEACAAEACAAGTRAVEAPPLLRVRGLARRNVLRPLDLDIDAGEVVGLAGLLGSGRTEAARLLFGIDRAHQGHVEIDGRRARIHSPRRAIARGLGFCPEDRKTEGLLPSLSVRENIVLAWQARRGWLRALPRSARRRTAEMYVRALGIATPDLDKPVGELSGGNQQKVILARWLAAQPRLLILDEPTRGIDVGAKAEIELLVDRLRRAGLAVLFISSELDEVVRNCGRAVVLRDRATAGELRGSELNGTAIMRLIAAHEEHA